MAGETTDLARGVGELGLRERKKQQTRERIIEAAFELFDRDGFDSTTVADIAAAADISPRTFFTYFPTKEDVVFNDNDKTRVVLQSWLDNRAEGENTIDAIRNGLTTVLEQLDFDSELAECRHRIIHGSDELLARKAGLTSEIEELLVEAVAKDLGEPATALRPRVVASVVIAAIRGVGDSVVDHSTVKAQLAELDEILVFLRGGLAAMQDDPQSQ